MNYAVTCTRCNSLPCRCTYEPLPLQVLRLSDDDVERIAQRVVELMREEKR